MIRYTTMGGVCGGCDHAHRSIGAAQRCAHGYHVSIVANNTECAHSDRHVVRVDGLPLSDWEVDMLRQVKDAIHAVSVGLVG